MDGVARYGEHLDAALAIQVLDADFPQNGQPQGSEKKELEVL